MTEWADVLLPRVLSGVMLSMAAQAGGTQQPPVLAWSGWIHQAANIKSMGFCFSGCSYH